MCGSLTASHEARIHARQSRRGARVARELRIGQVYLTHMGNGLDYRTLVAELPDWAAPAYDGLEVAL